MFTARMSSLAARAALLLVIVLLAVAAAAPSANALYVNCYLANIQFIDTQSNPVAVVAQNTQLIYPFIEYTLVMSQLSSTPIGAAHWSFKANLGLSSANISTFIGNTLVGFQMLNDASEATVQITGLPTHCGQALEIHFLVEQLDKKRVGGDRCAYDWIFKLTTSCVFGDPQFAGLRGQSYQVHGIDGAAYALISAPSYALNARFDFLDGPRPCAIIPSTGSRSMACWTHPGSYLGAIGLKTQAGETLLLEAGPAATGFAQMTLSSETQLKAGQRVELADGLGFVEVQSSHEVLLKVGVFEIELENNDEFINLRSVRVSPTQWRSLAQERVHGLLGQTWQLRRYMGSVKEIEGEVDDYVLENNDVLGHRFVFSRFAEKAAVGALKAL